MSSVEINSTETVPDKYLSDTPITENGKGTVHDDICNFSYCYFLSR
jgi:hypothetical protein